MQNESRTLAVVERSAPLLCGGQWSWTVEARRLGEQWLVGADGTREAAVVGGVDDRSRPTIFFRKRGRTAKFQIRFDK